MVDQPRHYNGSYFSGEDILTASQCVVREQSSPTWRELEVLEKRRRQILRKVELPVWRVILSWNGTCLRALCLDWLVWVPIIVFIVVRILTRHVEMVDVFADSNLRILGGFLSFFLVLFVNQNNTRFFESFKLAKACGTKITDIAGLASTKMRFSAAMRLIRYMNAAHVVAYVGLDGPYSREHFFNHINAKYQLLTTAEIESLQSFGWKYETFLELLTWCQHDIETAKKSGDIDSYESRELNQLLLIMKGSIHGIYNHCEQPVHFFYIHFLCLLSALYLPLFALKCAFQVDGDQWGSELLTLLIVSFQSIFVVGLRLLGQKMINPFGDDMEDLSVLTYVTGTIKKSRQILNSRRSPPVDEDLEWRLSMNDVKPRGAVDNVGEARDDSSSNQSMSGWETFLDCIGCLSSHNEDTSRELMIPSSSVKDLIKSCVYV